MLYFTGLLWEKNPWCHHAFVKLINQEQWHIAIRSDAGHPDQNFKKLIATFICYIEFIHATFNPSWLEINFQTT